MATLRATQRRVAAGASTLIVFSGAPNVAIEWQLDGPGELRDAATKTSDNGAASAVYEPGLIEGSATITVNYGA